MTIGKGKRPRDTNQLAKFIVDVTTEQIVPPDPYKGKNIAAVKAGTLGGRKGGRVRATVLPKSRRRAIAKKAAAARWKKS